MMVLNRYYHKFNQVPAIIKAFLLKGLLLLIAWKFIYLFLLQPGRVLDKPLTNFTAVSSVKTLNLLNHSGDFTAKPEIDEYTNGGITDKQPVMSIYYHQQKALSIADACNALELFILYAGFIICFPSGAKRKISFIAGGLIFICLVNILRCTALTWIFLYHPQYGDFSHHYLFTFTIYACIFLLWWWFTKKPAAHAKAW